jgi:tetratricopeptide (TPR) repeat protein
VFLLLSLALLAQQAQPPAPVEPPEEDETLVEKREYTFNPVQAQQEIKVGNFYFRKGSFRSAALRFEEATKWDESSAEAWRRLGEAQEKCGNKPAAKAAWKRVLELEPNAKDSRQLRKKLGDLR